MTRQEALQTAKPILFNTDMARAILNRRKTVTRRIIKPKYDNTHIDFIENKYGRQLVEIQNEDDVKETINPDGTHCRQLRAMVEITSPYKIDDILYVRETWCKGSLNYGKEQYYYKADDTIPHCTWKPSIHMPKEAARIFLRVTGVRVECLQDIDGYGVFLEGVDNGKSNPTMGNRWENMQKVAYSELWNSTVKKSDLDRYGWNANPWVWVIEFERAEVTK